MIKHLEDVHEYDERGDYVGIRKPNNREIKDKINEIIDVINANEFNRCNTNI